MKIIGNLIVAQALLAAFASAQVRPKAVVLPETYEKQPPNLFLERAYFALGTPSGKNLLFEGKPAVHYHLFNGFSDKVWQKGELRQGWAFAWPISALFEVRMIDTVSEPVRTPSYRIRPFNLQAVKISRYKDKLGYRMLGLSVGAAHYSNGQQGCTYVGEVRNEGGNCRPTEDDQGAIPRNNRFDGDFSTSYFSLGLNLRHGKLSNTSEPMKWQVTASTELQVHPIGLQPGGMNHQQARTYGQHQVSTTIDLERRFVGKQLACFPDFRQGVLRGTLQYESRFGGKTALPLQRASMEIAYTLDGASHVGVFLRHNVGYDYYNIWYDQRRPFLSIGLVWDVGRLDLLQNP